MTDLAGRVLERDVLDHGVIVQQLRLAIVVFDANRVVFRNQAAERLGRWLRDQHGTELTTVLRDHVAQLGCAGRPRTDSVSLVRIPEGSHLFIDVSTMNGHTVVAVRAPGLELNAIARHFGLSPRELEVAGHVLRGLSNQTIADLLQVSHDTVKKHLTRVFDKMGVDSRTQLMSLVS